MRVFRKLSILFFVMVFLLSFIPSTFADSLQDLPISTSQMTKENVKEFSFPIKLQSTENLYPQSQNSGAISPQEIVLVGRADLRVREIDGNLVVLDWDVVVTTPGAKIIHVYIDIIWDNVTTDPFHYSTFGVPTSVRNQSERVVSSGYHLAQMTGGVETTLGSYFIITPPTVFFEV
ncbi:hypothetical protein [uncultured Paenibacillus sp.]|uniref:hypothetical protein n=1 Tax=uncultured Paenibacillus sp. TaxID=227322 RepID=UPI0015ADA8AE|nr:hypothetical protein [uncultured Paenibacillus sp.]